MEAFFRVGAAKRVAQPALGRRYRVQTYLDGKGEVVRELLSQWGRNRAKVVACDKVRLGCRDGQVRCPEPGATVV